MERDPRDISHFKTKIWTEVPWSALELVWVQELYDIVMKLRSFQSVIKHKPPD